MWVICIKDGLTIRPKNEEESRIFRSGEWVNLDPKTFNLKSFDLVKSNGDFEGLQHAVLKAVYFRLPSPRELKEMILAKKIFPDSLSEAERVSILILNSKDWRSR